MRTAILGGTFDPVHVGHIVVAVAVHHALNLDETRVVVAADPWQKKTPPVCSAEHRYAAVRAAVDELDVSGIVADDSEIRRGGPTYTIDTVEELRTIDPSIEVFLIVGADVARSLDTWHRSVELRDLVTVVVVLRPGVGVQLSVPGWDCQTVEVPSLDVSSSDLRARLALGLPVDGLVPPGAMRVLRAHDRYSGSR